MVIDYQGCLVHIVVVHMPSNFHLHMVLKFQQSMGRLKLVEITIVIPYHVPFDNCPRLASTTYDEITDSVTILIK